MIMMSDEELFWAYALYMEEEYEKDRNDPLSEEENEDSKKE